MTGLFTEPRRREVALEGVPPLLVVDHWLAADAATELYDELAAGAPWFRPVLRIYGQEHLAPRSTAWYGDRGAVYRYSGTVNTPAPWPTSLATLRPRVERDAGAPFNSCLATLYRDGLDHVGWHADDERELGPVVASLSLGAPRRFGLRKADRHALKVELLLEHGTLLVMGPGVQEQWEHSLIKQRDAAGPRINLTWRSVRLRPSETTTP